MIKLTVEISDSQLVNIIAEMSAERLLDLLFDIAKARRRSGIEDAFTDTVAGWWGADINPLRNVPMGNVGEMEARAK